MINFNVSSIIGAIIPTNVILKAKVSVSFTKRQESRKDLPIAVLIKIPNIAMIPPIIINCNIININKFIKENDNINEIYNVDH